MDRHSEAYRHATEADRAGVDVSECVVCPPDDTRPIRPPEVFEEARWDHGREGPKTAAQARQALAQRIADPAAPDDESVAGAYDDLEG